MVNRRDGRVLSDFTKSEIGTLDNLHSNAAFRVSSTFGPIPTYSGEALEKIVKTMETDIPLNGTYYLVP